MKTLTSEGAGAGSRRATLAPDPTRPTKTGRTKQSVKSGNVGRTFPKTAVIRITKGSARGVISRRLPLMQYTILLEWKLTKQELRAEILLVEQMSRDRPRPIAKEGRKVRKRALSEELAREQPAAPECWPLQPPLVLPTPSMYYQPLRRVYVQAGRYFCTSALQ